MVPSSMKRDLKGEHADAVIKLAHALDDWAKAGADSLEVVNAVQRLIFVISDTRDEIREQSAGG